MEERIQKLLSRCGIMSRRAAERLVSEGRITVNGRPAVPGQPVDPQRDAVAVDGVPVKLEAQEPVYLMLNKPRGYVTTLHDEKGRRTAADLVADCGRRVYPVGRLDMDSEGLLLLTSDGDWADRMMHPSHEVEKVYLVWAAGAAEDTCRRLSQPMMLDGCALRPAAVQEKFRSPDYVLLQMTIHEGHNRQIRRMCEACGLHVTRLRRIAEGPLQLGDLAPGKWRWLTEQERILTGAGQRCADFCSMAVPDASGAGSGRPDGMEMTGKF